MSLLVDGRLSPFRLVTAVVALAAGLTASSLASAFDAESGHRLAARWCAKCHLIGPSDVASDAAPAFEDIANDPTRTPERLRTWLADPHPPMPDFSLSREEIDAILAYLDTLRKE